MARLGNIVAGLLHEIHFAPAMGFMALRKISPRCGKEGRPAEGNLCSCTSFQKLKTRLRPPNTPPTPSRGLPISFWQRLWKPILNRRLTSFCPAYRLDALRSIGLFHHPLSCAVSQALIKHLVETDSKMETRSCFVEILFSE